MATPSQVSEHRRDLNELVRLALVDLGVVFARNTEPEPTRDQLQEVLPAIVGLYGAAAATLAADWYDDLRDLAAPRRPFRAIPAELPGPDRTDILARWAVGPMFAETPDITSARTLAEGGLQRIIVDADRTTITVSSVEDRAATGWKRSSSDGCDLCKALAGKFSTSPEFTRTHDHCRCVPVPIFE